MDGLQLVNANDNEPLVIRGRFLSLNESKIKEIDALISVCVV